MQINREMTGQQAYQKLTDLCSRSEHCQHEMLEKMRLWGVSEEDQAQVMERLINERYVDDSRFARAFIYDKIRYSKWGRRKVEQALWAKRIDVPGRNLDAPRRRPLLRRTPGHDRRNLRFRLQRYPRNDPRRLARRQNAGVRRHARPARDA